MWRRWEEAVGGGAATPRPQPEPGPADSASSLNPWEDSEAARESASAECGGEGRGSSCYSSAHRHRRSKSGRGDEYGSVRMRCRAGVDCSPLASNAPSAASAGEALTRCTLARDAFGRLAGDGAMLLRAAAWQAIEPCCCGRRRCGRGG